LRRRLGLSQAQFAKLLGVHRVTVTRWETGTVKVQVPMAKLIRMMGQSEGLTRARGTR